MSVVTRADRKTDDGSAAGPGSMTAGPEPSNGLTRDETQVAEDQVIQTLSVLAAEGIVVPPGSKVLDLGCGNGLAVAAWKSRGYSTLGCDIELAQETPELKRIGLDPYRLPFPDDHFDLVVSHQVVEHVMDLGSFFSEVDRVTKGTGVSVHVFPSIWLPIECHTFVPLGSVVRGRPWLRLWAAVGIRNRFQVGKKAKEVMKLNHAYLHAHTNYKMGGRYLDIVRSRFPGARFCYEPSAPASRSNGVRGWIRRTLPVPLLKLYLRAYRTVGNRFLLLAR